MKKPSNPLAEIVTLKRDLLNTKERLHSCQIERDVAAKNLLDLEQKLHDGNIWNAENPRWTPRVKEALELAENEAKSVGASYVGTEHLLLGMLRQGQQIKGTAHRHFVASGMTYEKVAYALRVGRVA